MAAFEAIGLRDDEVRGDAAVGPTAYTEFFRIGNALREGVIHHGHVVLEILVAPIRKNGFTEFLAVAEDPRGFGRRTA